MYQDGKHTQIQINTKKTYNTVMVIDEIILDYGLTSH